MWYLIILDATSFIVPFWKFHESRSVGRSFLPTRPIVANYSSIISPLSSQCSSIKHGYNHIITNKDHPCHQCACWVPSKEIVSAGLIWRNDHVVQENEVSQSSWAHQKRSLFLFHHTVRALLHRWSYRWICEREEQPLSGCVRFNRCRLRSVRWVVDQSLWLALYWIFSCLLIGHK